MNIYKNCLSSGGVLSCVAARGRGAHDETRAFFPESSSPIGVKSSVSRNTRKSGVRKSGRGGTSGKEAESDRGPTEQITGDDTDLFAHDVLLHDWDYSQWKFVVSSCAILVERPVWYDPELDPVL